MHRDDDFAGLGVALLDVVIASDVCSNGNALSITGRSTPASYRAPSWRSWGPLARMKKNS
jgi:hypothetical protein